MDPRYPSIGERFYSDRECIDKNISVEPILCPLDVSLRFCFPASISLPQPPCMQASSHAIYLLRVHSVER